jgi:hypothetical protein
MYKNVRFYQEDRQSEAEDLYRRALLCSRRRLLLWWEFTWDFYWDFILIFNKTLMKI